jgi:hypothetical protein
MGQSETWERLVTVHVDYTCSLSGSRLGNATQTSGLRIGTCNASTAPARDPLFRNSLGRAAWPIGRPRQRQRADAPSTAAGETRSAGYQGPVRILDSASMTPL